MSHQYRGNKKYTTPPKGMPTEKEVGEMLDKLETVLPMTRQEIIMRAVQKYYTRHFEMKANFPVSTLLSDQGHRCYYCGKLLTEVTATIDHMLPLSRGGKNDRDNLCAACSPCNGFKSSMTAEEFIEYRKTVPEETLKMLMNRNPQIRKVAKQTLQFLETPNLTDEEAKIIQARGTCSYLEVQAMDKWRTNRLRKSVGLEPIK